MKLPWQNNGADLSASQDQTGTLTQMDDRPSGFGVRPTSHNHGPAASTIAELPTAPAKPSSTSEAQSTEAKLFAAMDRAALTMLSKLENDKLNEDGTPVVSGKEWKENFRLAMDWLAKSKRLRPDDEDDLPKGVEGMKRFIAEAIDEIKPRSGRPAGSKTKPKGEGDALAKALEARK